MGEGRQGDNASQGANSRESESVLTDSCSLCKVYVCVCASGRKRGKKTENYIMYARVAQGGFVQPRRVSMLETTATETVLHPSSPALINYHHSGFKITNSIFNVQDNLVVIIHRKMIQTHPSCGTQCIQYSYETDCMNHGITCSRKTTSLVNS